MHNFIHKHLGYLIYGWGLIGGVGFAAEKLPVMPELDEELSSFFWNEKTPTGSSAEAAILAPLPVTLEQSAAAIKSPSADNAAVKPSNSTPIVIEPAVFAPPLDGVSVLATMQAVVDYSPSLEAIRKLRDAQNYEVKKAQGGYLPSVDLNSRVGTGVNDNVVTRAAKDNYATSGAAGISATQILWNGLAVKSAVDFNIFRVESLDYRVCDNATYLALEGLIAHVEILRAREVLTLADNYVAVHRRILDIQKNLDQSGLSTGADVSQAQGRLSRALAAQNSARNAYQTAQVYYQKLTGKTPPENLAAGTLPQQLPTTTEAMTTYALRNNPKILALSSDINAAHSQIKQAKSAYHPQLSLSLGADYNDPYLPQRRELYGWNAGANLGLRWNLFDGLATTNSVRAAQEREKSAINDLSAMNDAVVADVITTNENLTFANEQIATLAEMLIYNTQTRDNYLEQFQFGTRRLLDVLDAESELFNTQTQLATFRANGLINTWKLLALQGRLLRELPHRRCF